MKKETITSMMRGNGTQICYNILSKMCSFPHKNIMRHAKKQEKCDPAFYLFLFQIDEERDFPPFIVCDSQTQHLTPDR